MKYNAIMVKQVVLVVAQVLYVAIGFVFWIFAAVMAFIAGMIISSKGKS
jgi:hypothetical protein